MSPHKKKNNMKRLFTIAAALLLLAACTDFEPFLYQCAVMGYTRTANTIKGDDGCIYSFDFDMIENSWDTGTRVFVLMDVTEAVSDSVFKATNASFIYPLYKDPIVLEAGEIPDTLGTDGILMSDGWYSGGCLNMANRINVVEGVGYHRINLLVDKREEDSDTLRMQLFHRWVDAVESVTASASGYSFYSSFPIRQYLPEKDSVVLKISWTWDGEASSLEAKVKR